jgi:hypothetical protein
MSRGSWKIAAWSAGGQAVGGHSFLEVRSGGRTRREAALVSLGAHGGPQHEESEGQAKGSGYGDFFRFHFLAPEKSHAHLEGSPSYCDHEHDQPPRHFSQHFVPAAPRALVRRAPSHPVTTIGRRRPSNPPGTQCRRERT